MTITSVKANESMDFKLEFMKPFKSVSDIGFTLARKGEATDVTWTLVGPKNFILKGMKQFRLESLNVSFCGLLGR